MLSTTPEQVLRNPANNSPAKHHWTFSKAERFGATTQATKVAYDLPSTLRKLSYSFGKDERRKRGSVGTRYPDHTPAPGAYSPTNCSRGSAWSFNKGATLHTTPPVVTPGPGPGTYEVTNKDFGKHAVKYSLRPRTATPGESPSRVQYVKNTPGPGAYEPKDSLDSTGTYFVSKYGNSKAMTFSPAKVTRFDSRDPPQSPGPGAYNPKSALSSTGDYFVSVYKSSQSRRFGKAQSRASSALRQSSPGPAAYTLPNEFGIYGTPYASRSVSRRTGSIGRASRISSPGRSGKSPDGESVL